MSILKIFKTDIAKGVESMVEERKDKLYKGETVMLWCLIRKTLPWILLCVVLNSVITFLSFIIALDVVDLGRYAIKSGKVSMLLTVYGTMIILSLLVFIAISFIVSYVIGHNIVAPIMRITDELTTGVKKVVRVRRSDEFLLPLVNKINEIILSK